MNPDTKNHPHTNRLIHATSPYLLQHAHNPIDWYEWGEEAFARAVKEDKPIFLSIGYAACHWCHVMEHETFESEAVARAVNDRFIFVKVDREERPDVDEIYMQVTTMMNRGQGGWPMSVWLMPDRRPIYAATYLPQENFLHVCDRIHELWRDNRSQLLEQGDRIQAHLDRWAKGDPPDESIIQPALIDRMARHLAQFFDVQSGGFRSDANKFPPSMAMELMLRMATRTHDEKLLVPIEITLDHMARGGIYDHLGGGHLSLQHRPRVAGAALREDALRPGAGQQHLSRRLPGNAQRRVRPRGPRHFRLRTPRPAIAAGWLLFHPRRGQRRSRGRVLHLDRRAGACRARRSGRQPLLPILRRERRGQLVRVARARTGGPKNILRVSKPPEVFAKLHGLSVEALESKIAAWREQMLAVREQRVPPGLDDKILTAWNGLMIASLAKGAVVLDEPRYAAAAARAADFVLKELRRDGRLLRTYRNGEARLAGYLSDYAFFIEGLLNLYEATFDPRWLNEAVALDEVLTRYYLDTQGGAYFFTAADAEALIARTKNPRDGAIPSATRCRLSPAAAG
jgi:uncharacterized protein YyaL (SSP411 family)